MFVLSATNMQACAYDILWHGTVSLASALQWAFLCMLNFPDVQEKARDEILAAISVDDVSVCDFDDRERLPFVKALVLEVTVIEKLHT